MKKLIYKIANYYKSLSKDFKQYFIWPLFIALLSFLMTSIFWIYSDDSSKKNALREKKLSIISDLTESYYSFYYHSGFRGIIDLEQLDFVKYFKKMDPEKLQIVELSIKERIQMSDSLKKTYPFAYDKMIEGDIKVSTLFKNLQLARLFFNESVNFKVDEFQSYVPIDNKINEYIKKRMETNSTVLSESEKNKLLESIQIETNNKFSELMNEMVKDVP